MYSISPLVVVENSTESCILLVLVILAGCFGAIVSNICVPFDCVLDSIVYFCLDLFCILEM